MVVCREIAVVAPGLGFEAQVENAVEFVKGDAHFEAGPCGGEAIAAGLLHDGLTTLESPNPPELN